MAQSNLTAVLFTLGLIYTGQLALCISRTYKQVFRQGPRDQTQKVFITFYTFVYAMLALTVILYFLLSARALTQTTSAKIGVISLYFVPTVLMVLCYVLLYHQCEKLMVKSRILGNDGYSIDGQS